MKKTTIALFALVFSILILPNYSCDTEDLIGTFNAEVDGAQWSAIAPAAVKTGNRFTISGISTNAQIILNTNGTGVGTYSMNVFSGNIQPFVYTPDVVNNPQATYVGTAGSIQITEVTSSRVSGSFNVTATNASSTTASITGSFTNVIYHF